MCLYKVDPENKLLCACCTHRHTVRAERKALSSQIRTLVCVQHFFFFFYRCRCQHFAGTLYTNFTCRCLSFLFFSRSHIFFSSFSIHLWEGKLCSCGTHVWPVDVHYNVHWCHNNNFICVRCVFSQNIRRKSRLESARWNVLFNIHTHTRGNLILTKFNFLTSHLLQKGGRAWSVF